MKEGYSTRQGAVILAYLEKNIGPYTAEELAEALRAQRVGKATVYRHLERLCEGGLVRRFFPAEGASASYQYVGGHGDCSRHYHMVCSRCGRLFHLDCHQLCTLTEHIEEQHGFLLDAERTILYGVCADCRSNDKKEDKA